MADKKLKNFLWGKRHETILKKLRVSATQSTEFRITDALVIRALINNADSMKPGELAKIVEKEVEKESAPKGKR